MELIELTKDVFDYVASFRQKVAQARVPDIDVVRHEIESVFAGMETKLGSYPRLVNEYRLAKYPLVALVDETILSSSWNQAKKWEQYLLEKKYYQTNIAGNQFFQLLSSVDKMPPSVVRVYFYCLSFGFRGGFAPTDPALLRLRARLLSRVAPTLGDLHDKLAPSAYSVDNTINRPPARLWKWRHLIVAAVLVLVVFLVIERLLIWPIIMSSKMSISATTDAVQTEDGSEAAPAAPVQPPAPQGFTVQLGSFKSELMAQHYAKQMEQSSVKSKILVQTPSDGGKSIYLVVSGNFETDKDAQFFLKQAKEASTMETKMAVLTLAQAHGDCIAGCGE